MTASASATTSVKRVLPLPIPLSLMQNSFFQGRAEPMPRKRDLAYILTSNHDSSDESTHPSVIEESGIGGEHLARLDPASRSSSVSPGRRRRHALSKPTTSTPNLRSRSNKRTPPRPPNLREPRSRYCADIPTTLDPSLRLLLQLLMEEPFYSNDQLEPVLGCPESQSLLIKSGTEGLANDPKLVGKSIYWLFIDEEKKQCRICGTHRLGAEEQRAVVTDAYKSLDMRDSSREPYSTTTSRTSISLSAADMKTAKLRRGEMRRHWELQHQDDVFTPDSYRRYNRSVHPSRDQRDVRGKLD